MFFSICRGMVVDELVMTSSSVNCGIGCWDLRSGAEQLRYRSCASPFHGLLSVSGHFLASSQIRESPSSTTAPILYWSWDKPQVEVKSFPAEPIGPLVSDHDGSHIIGGGSSGQIYIWEVASGKLLTKWNAHYRSVTCLTLSSNDSLLISGSQDGSVRVWPLLMVFDEAARDSGENIYMYSFSEHALPVTSVISGQGLASIFISSSEDRTCKVWSLFEGRLLRSIAFPCVIDAISVDPLEHAFYAGCRDGKIYIAALHAEWVPSQNHGNFIIGSLSDHGKAITCLAFSSDGATLVSGSDDGTVRVWNTHTKQLIRMWNHAKAPISNIIIVPRPDRQAAGRKLKHTAMAAPLGRYIDPELKSQTHRMPAPRDPAAAYCAISIMTAQIEELQHISSAAAAQMEAGRWRLECEKLKEENKRWKIAFAEELSSLVSNADGGSSM